jgi:hypothetical protein
VLAVLVSGCSLLVACERERELPAPAPPESSLVTTSVPTEPSTSVPTSSSVLVTSTVVPATTQPASTQPATTQAGDGFADVAWGADVVEVASPFTSNPFEFRRAGTYGDLLVYDGETSEGSFQIRCVVVASASRGAWSESCLEPGVRASAVYVAGADPWIVEVGAESGDVVVTQQPSDWAITSSGCAEPIVTLLAAAAIEPAMATGLACAANEAFVTFASVLLQPGPVDGGGLLLINGDEGWNSEGGGTSFDCAPGADGIDRCALFEVESELSEAVTALPGPELLPPQADVVNVRTVTLDVAAMAAGAADLDAITNAVMASLTPPEPELAPTMVRHDHVGFGDASLLIVEVPLADDSVRSTTYSIWISSQPAIHRAYAWNNCGRGLASPGLCV